MAELLLLEDMSSRQQNYIETIHSSARGLIHIINDILDYSKIEAGELSLEVLEFDIRQLLQECLDIFRVQAEEKNIELSLQCHLDLDVSVYGDPTRIRQIVINLLSNSLKFTEKGHVCLKADLNNDGNTDSLILSVEDTGVGMTEEQRDRVFTAFQQADNSTARQYGGTGLGLSITQQLVEMMGGTINVTSAVGKGTFFELSIPIGAAQDNQIMDTGTKDKGGNRGEESAFSREWGG